MSNSPRWFFATSVFDASPMRATAAREKLKNNTDWPGANPSSMRLTAFFSAIVVFPLPGPPITRACPSQSRSRWRSGQISIMAFTLPARRLVLEPLQPVQLAQALLLQQEQEQPQQEAELPPSQVLQALLPPVQAQK